MEIQPEFIEQSTQQDKAFRRIGIILKVITLAVAFFAIVMMSL